MPLGSHEGAWTGENRLWLGHDTPAARSQGALVVADRSLEITWEYQGEVKRGTLAVSGPSPCLSALWVDSWHMAAGMRLNGFAEAGLVRLWGTYPAGEGPDWGWTIELDAREPDALVLRMFNVFPDGLAPPGQPNPQIAVHLRATRA